MSHPTRPATPAARHPGRYSVILPPPRDDAELVALPAPDVFLAAPTVPASMRATTPPPRRRA